MTASHSLPVLMRVLSASLTLAKRAGQLIKDVQMSGKSLDIVDKGHNDPQTRADRASQQLIISALAQHFPQLTIRGEEVLLVLERRAHVYVHASRGCSLWDTCAPEAVLKAGGGMLTDVFGNKISYLSTNETSVNTGVLATMENHDWYAQRIRETITL
ncbi:unnamed protein product [Rotaria magnacalcarata]|uniref:3'(2'),5'-bisphosphate nucleotidase 1 n=1 Tax=Rotaria magnacalcarata TaxID=392030 RepID=A0A8S2M6F7_9BILA|nr:unnamed protein product [Rotaria magnacalcarata]